MGLICERIVRWPKVLYMSQAITLVQKNTARLKTFFFHVCKTEKILFPCLSVQRVLVLVIWDNWGLFGIVGGEIGEPGIVDGDCYRSAESLT